MARGLEDRNERRIIGEEKNASHDQKLPHSHPGYAHRMRLATRPASP